ncbi:GrpB domain, predicted nucleotidyltransferase, UPF0157 family [Alkalibacterium gilvum]|uniref:GrpB domain, predicted nucleotidyltransferase, UPF0157 family n=1 Tax=Alkalibacterium gilvum TaxID=1130080 RepID=A0A1H6UAV8_9LACT|nr:GrpB family protein [Alkalibacterium gilvum]SEI86767.1 GrpB domain, predicted nucleotidyltransferase, UPF0157 family [Alkalibacterium gilvum]
MLGLPKDEVFLVPWTEDWTKDFLSERKRIQNKTGKFIVDIHHIGSTSVRGLSAKPIIDIAIEINNFYDGDQCVTPLKDLGYSYGGVNILPDRHYFYKGEPRTHQIHMYQTGSKFLIEQLNFRDCLRNNDKIKREYQELKMSLSESHKHNKHKYADEKTNFINSILAKNPNTKEK